MALASGCGITSDLAFEDFPMMDCEDLLIRGTASNTTDMYQNLHDTSFLAGDPYPEPETVRSFDPNSASGILPSYDQLAAWTGYRRFKATDVPPGVPMNVCFRLAIMTYWLRGIDAHIIANTLLDFLSAKMDTAITKVSHAKFSIKVQIGTDGSDCVAKLRMYSNDANGALALELQRRSGCGLVFNRFYQEVGYFLAARQKSVEFELLNAPEGGSSQVRTDTNWETDAEAEPAALMMLAHSQSQTRWMDAEPSFADVACKNTSANMFSTDAGFVGLQEFLQCDKEETLFHSGKLFCKSLAMTGNHNLPQTAWTHEEDLFRSGRRMDVE